MLAMPYAKSFQPSDQSVCSAIQFSPSLAATVVDYRNLVGFTADKFVQKSGRLFQDLTGLEFRGRLELRTGIALVLFKIWPFLGSFFAERADPV